MSILGTTEPAAGEQLPRRPKNVRELERAYFADALQEMKVLAQTMTAFAERLGGRAVNHVLLVETQTFDASAQIARQFHVPAGSIEVTNLSGANTITVHAAGPSSAAPGAGVGVYRVPPNSTRTIGLASRQVTLYGTNADVVSFQVWSAGAAPVA